MSLLGKGKDIKAVFNSWITVDKKKKHMTLEEFKEAMVDHFAFDTSNNTKIVDNMSPVFKAIFETLDKPTGFIFDPNQTLEVSEFKPLYYALPETSDAENAIKNLGETVFKLIGEKGKDYIMKDKLCDFYQRTKTSYDSSEEQNEQTRRIAQKEFNRMIDVAGINKLEAKITLDDFMKLWYYISGVEKLPENGNTTGIDQNLSNSSGRGNQQRQAPSQLNSMVNGNQFDSNQMRSSLQNFSNNYGSSNGSVNQNYDYDQYSYGGY